MRGRDLSAAETQTLRNIRSWSGRTPPAPSEARAAAAARQVFFSLIEDENKAARRFTGRHRLTDLALTRQNDGVYKNPPSVLTT